MHTWVFIPTLLLALFCYTRAECGAPSVTTFTVNGVRSPPICSGDLIFEDNFDTENSSTWLREVTLSSFGTGGFEYYTDDSKVSYIDNGTLHIKPTLLSSEKGEDFLYSGTIDFSDRCTTKTDCKRTGQQGSILNPISSARLRTRNFSFKYGKLEARVKCPVGNWLWTGVRLTPAESVYGEWPRSGQIDLAESRGNQDLGYPFTATSTLQWGPDPTHNMYSKTRYPKGDGSGYAAVYHYFQLEWTPDHIAFSVDDHHYGKLTPPSGGFWELANLTGGENPWRNGGVMAPFDQEFQIVLGLAVGGTNGYFPESYGKPWRNDDERFKAMTAFWEGRNQWLNSWKPDGDDTHFQVDYVRVWAL